MSDQAQEIVDIPAPAITDIPAPIEAIAEAIAEPAIEAPIEAPIEAIAQAIAPTLAPQGDCHYRTADGDIFYITIGNDTIKLRKA